MKQYIKQLFVKTAFLTTFLICLLPSMRVFSQSANTYRNANWHPEKGKYFFSEVMEWEFLNESLPADDEGHAGTFNVYFDRKSGVMLFTQEAYGISSEMTDFIIIQPNGRYIEGFTDEFGKNYHLIDTLQRFSETINDQLFIREDFKKLAKPTGKFKVFGTNKYGWPTVRAELHELSFLKTMEKSQIYLGKMPFSQLPLFLFNELEGDAKLPVNFNFSLVIPREYWVLEDVYSYKNAETGRKVTFRTTLKSISPTEYFVDLKDYKFTKKL